MNANNAQHKPKQEPDARLAPASTHIIAGYTPKHYYDSGYVLQAYQGQVQAYLPM